jgi:hypothetical protein
MRPTARSLRGLGETRSARPPASDRDGPSARREASRSGTDPSPMPSVRREDLARAPAPEALKISHRDCRSRAAKRWRRWLGSY